MPDYRLKYDFHTHTVFSHGKGTIEQNVMRAREIGLAAIAISDLSLPELMACTVSQALESAEIGRASCRERV